MILRRGSVALRPALLRSCGEVLHARDSPRRNWPSYNTRFIETNRAARPCPEFPSRAHASATPALALLAGARRGWPAARPITAALRYVHAVHQPVRRLQARHQPGQLHFAGYGRQAEGRARPSSRCRQVLGTPLITSVFRDNRWDYVYEFTGRAGASRAPAVHRLFQRRHVRALGRRRDAAVGAGVEPDSGHAAHCRTTRMATTPASSARSLTGSTTSAIHRHPRCPEHGRSPPRDRGCRAAGWGKR